MIDVKQAVQIAKEKALEMLGTPANLEEIERDSYKGHEVWSITLSLPNHPSPQTSPQTRLFQLANPLPYKRFLIDVETGEFLAMKLRELATQ